MTEYIPTICPGCNHTVGESVGVTPGGECSKCGHSVVSDTDTERVGVTDAVAYIYEHRVVGDPGWTKRATVRHPRELGFDEADSVEYRHVRPLFEREQAERGGGHD